MNTKTCTYSQFSVTRNLVLPLLQINCRHSLSLERLISGTMQSKHSNAVSWLCMPTTLGDYSRNLSWFLQNHAVLEKGSTVNAPETKVMQHGPNTQGFCWSQPAPCSNAAGQQLDLSDSSKYLSQIPLRSLQRLIYPEFGVFCY